MVSSVSKVWFALPLFLCSCIGQDSLPANLPSPTANPGIFFEINEVETAPDTEAISKAVESWHQMRKPDETIKRIEAFPVPGSPTLFIAICDHEPHWWGFFGLYKLEEGHIAWQASCDKPPDENSIRNLQARTLPGFGAPIVEVYGMTHMGNGNLYLYELQNRKLVLLLKTRAVDDHWGDGFVFHEGRLIPKYTDLNGDGVTDLVLKGDIEERVEQGNRLVSAHLCQKVFLWNKDRHRFEEDLSRRIGLEDKSDL